MKSIFKLASLFALLFYMACSSGGGNGGTEPEQPTVDELIAQGWAAFEAGNYQTAQQRFTEARQIDSSPVDIFVGLGWSLFRLDQLTQASNEFRAGSDRSDAPADLFAGYAFVLNALKRYTNSNTQADAALSRDANWSFSHGTGLNADDLRVLKAQNFFLLGEFASSLNEVKNLNPSFAADVRTAEGQQALAAEIERLKMATQ